MPEEKNKNRPMSIAKEESGDIQINFTIPFEEIAKGRKEAIIHLGENFEVPGFRKGKAPYEKLLSALPQNRVLEETLSKLLPNLLAKAIEEYKIKPVVYPKFELVKAQENEDWQITAHTCEIPEFSLGDYKKVVAGTLRAKNIWTPSKKEETNKEPNRQEKEEEVIKALIENVKIKIPKLLINDEVDSRLAKLLERIEKLGLNLDSYLASIGKSAEVLRDEYQKQAKDAIALDLILSKIAEEEKIEVSEKDVEAAITAGSADPKLVEELKTPERRSFIESILKRRSALDSLINSV